MLSFKILNFKIGNAVYCKDALEKTLVLTVDREIGALRKYLTKPMKRLK
jgi:hypothetical protein